MGKHSRQAQRPVEEPKQAEALVEQPAPPVVDEAVAQSPPGSPSVAARHDAEALDAHGKVECEALQGVMHLGQFLPPGSKFSLERQLYRRLKKLGCVIGRRQD
jgi:hypothetical protein